MKLVTVFITHGVTARHRRVPARVLVGLSRRPPRVRQPFPLRSPEGPFQPAARWVSSHEDAACRQAGRRVRLREGAALEPVLVPWENVTPVTNGPAR